MQEIYRETLKKCTFLELLHQMGQYLTWNITRTKELKKSLGSQMATP